MRESGEQPIFPESETGGGRFESADVEIEELRKFLNDTKFESEEALLDILSTRYNMHRNESISNIKSGMTRIMNIKEIMRERKILEDKPLSGKEPQAVMRTSIDTLDGKNFDLRVFRVYNRNQEFRYEYILKQR